MAVGPGRASLDSQGPLAPRDSTPGLRTYSCKHSQAWAVSLTRSPGGAPPDPAVGFSATQVWYREDVSHPNPEGSSWSLMDTPGEAVQISCGPHDLLWVTLWEGQALVREGINRNNPKGGQPYAPHTGRGRGMPTLLPSALADEGLLLFLLGPGRKFLVHSGASHI